MGEGGYIVHAEDRPNQSEKGEHGYYIKKSNISRQMWVKLGTVLRSGTFPTRV